MRFSATSLYKVAEIKQNERKQANFLYLIALSVRFFRAKVRVEENMRFSEPLFRDKPLYIIVLTLIFLVVIFLLLKNAYILFLKITFLLGCYHVLW